MSALPSATAAKTDRESADHDTVRAMNVGRPVKSVIWRQSPFDVDSAQMFVLNPSVNGRAIHFPSGDKLMPELCHDGKREDDTWPITCDGPSSGLAAWNSNWGVPSTIRPSTTK